MTTRNRQKIIVFAKEGRCRCGKPVTSHHFLCDSCYSERARAINKRKKKKILDKAQAARDRKKTEKEVKKLEKEVKKLQKRRQTKNE